MANESERTLISYGAAGEVTGSCHLFRTRTATVLVDCGLFQGQDSERNEEPLPFDPKEIDAVVLSHAHIDHSGRLPLLVKRGYRGPILTHSASRDLCRILLRDSAFIHEQDAKWENRRRRSKRGQEVQPLYTQEDAHRAMKNFEVVEYGEEFEVADGVRGRLRDAGHILGSAIVELWFEAGGTTRKVVFSGDLGHANKPVLCDPEAITESDLVLLESTYGDRSHRDWDATWSELGEIFSSADHEGGNVLIPSFAVGRTQQLLHAFQEHFDEWGLERWKIYLDSPLAIEATRVYAEHEEVYDPDARRAVADHGSPFALPNLVFCPEAEDSMRLNSLHSGAIIIAGSGMCTGGRIKHHLKHHATRPGCQLVIVGYQARGTLGRSIVDGVRDVRLYGDEVRLEARVHTVGGLSAHADAPALSRWYGNFEGHPPVVLIHGEPGPRTALAERLRTEHSASAIHLPRPGERIAF